MLTLKTARQTRLAFRPILAELHTLRETVELNALRMHRVQRALDQAEAEMPTFDLPRARDWQTNPFLESVARHLATYAVEDHLLWPISPTLAADVQHFDGAVIPAFIVAAEEAKRLHQSDRDWRPPFRTYFVQHDVATIAFALLNELENACKRTSSTIHGIERQIRQGMLRDEDEPSQRGVVP